MPWLQLSIETNEEQASIIELIFQNLGALSVTFSDAGDQALLEPIPGEEKIWHNTCVTGLFSAEQNTEELRSALGQVLSPDAIRSLHMDWLSDRAWERVWLDDFKPMQFGKRLWICPDGQIPKQANAIVVELDPGLAFGTGTHPTTALCLEWLDSCHLSGKTLIDYGCGSGILAIAALQLGAKQAIAVDYDPQAILATRNNAERNRVADRLHTYLPDQLPRIETDYLVANILAGPLIELAPKLCNLIQENGKFALSGILVEQGERVTSAYAKYAKLQTIKRSHDWVLLNGVIYK